MLNVIRLGSICNYCMSDRLSGHILNNTEPNANELFNQQSVYDLHTGLSRVAYWQKNRVRQEKDDYAAKKVYHIL